ncbi:phosphomannomutase [Saccharomonospora amisosensis]|uniref:Phosphomannomutase n=1 Tax=Saccharomonospora amisosensis TaxID=1128677 RepID=A0A7X5UTP5_9PSEU|nr:phospho-sugar mutase [Saccharomonospora amisosensis]NIJ14061.1 phosphomannomutase [Saccharomonospora amisosensis]
MEQNPPRLTSAERDRALRWIADDVTPHDRTELQEVLAAAMNAQPDAVAELRERMAGELAFGTAGLRGPVRAGPNGMNTAVVVRATAGVASWLRGEGRAGRTVIVGRDARHGSADFATAAAEVLTAAGFDVRLLPAALPTPLLAFAVRRLGAAAGIQITASHNPPADNGYKVYDHTGALIVPPADRRIESAIEAAPAAISVPRSPGAEVLGDDVLQAYLDRVARLPRGSARELRVVATALHGVGADTLRLALRRAGFTDVGFVPEQEEPDPDFPTVAFPNPEEPQAGDLLLDLAQRTGADLAIALDPDADRCALGVAGRDGRWRLLRGDETGVLLGEHVLSGLNTPDPLVATTIVSSSMLASIAKAHGARYEETLTGFKWLARAGAGLVYAYEEALGVCVDPETVRDKDGIAAAVVACDLTAQARAANRSLLDLLDDLALRHGLHLTDQVSLRIADLAERGRVMARLREHPPTELLGTAVVAQDLLPRADVLRLRGEDLRVVVRPSGTEPKLKAYLEVTAPVPAPAELHRARDLAERRLAGLRSAVRDLLAG